MNLQGLSLLQDSRMRQLSEYREKRVPQNRVDSECHHIMGDCFFAEGKIEDRESHFTGTRDQFDRQDRAQRVLPTANQRSV